MIRWKGLGRHSQVMELDRQVLLEASEVRICRENGHLVSHGYGTDEKVGVGTLNPLSATQMIELGGGLEICGCQLKIGKWSQMIAKLRELINAFDSRKDFLPYRSNQLYPQLLDQLHQLRRFRRPWTTPGSDGVEGISRQLLGSQLSTLL